MRRLLLRAGDEAQPSLRRPWASAHTLVIVEVLLGTRSQTASAEASGVGMQGGPPFPGQGKADRPPVGGRARPVGTCGAPRARGLPVVPPRDLQGHLRGADVQHTPSVIKPCRLCLEGPFALDCYNIQTQSAIYCTSAHLPARLFPLVPSEGPRKSPYNGGFSVPSESRWTSQLLAVLFRECPPLRSARDLLLCNR